MGKNYEVWEKYDYIWDVIKNKLDIEFHSQPIYENRYIKAKVIEFNGNIKTKFLGNDIPKENTCYTCVACITIDSVLKIDKKNYPQVYLEQCKYKVKQVRRFITIELDPDLQSDLEEDTGSNTKAEK